MIVSHTDRQEHGPYVTLNGEKLDTVCKYNYLGVVIDNDLTFSTFLINEKCNKISTRKYQRSRLRKFITGNIACLI